jgi:hypothetical protein
MKKIWLLLPEEIVEYLEKNFRTTDASLDAYFADLIRAEMSIGIIKPKKETNNYRFIRKKTMQLSNMGKELTAETLVQYKCGGAVLNTHVARDYLARMAKDGYVVLVGRDAQGRKIYAWAGKNPE